MVANPSIGRIIVDADPPAVAARKRAVAKLAAKQTAEQIVASMGDATRLAFAAKWDGRMETARWLSERSGIPVYRVLEVARLLGISNPPGAQPSSPAIHSAAVQREVIAAHAPRDLSDERFAERIAADLGADEALATPQHPRTFVPIRREREEPPTMAAAAIGPTGGETGKTCAICGTWKPYSDFRFAPKAPDRHARHCIACHPSATHVHAVKQEQQQQQEREHTHTPAAPAPAAPAPAPAPIPAPEPSVEQQPTVIAVAAPVPVPAPMPADTDGAHVQPMPWTPLMALLEQLPEDRTWSSGERGRWVRAFEGVLDWLVEVVEQPARG